MEVTVKHECYETRQIKFHINDHFLDIKYSYEQLAYTLEQ